MADAAASSDCWAEGAGLEAEARPEQAPSECEDVPFSPPSQTESSFSAVLLFLKQRKLSFVLHREATN